MEDVESQPHPIPKLATWAQTVRPWFFAGVGAIGGGVSFCLLTCGRLDGRHIIGSVFWGAMPGVILLLVPLFLLSTNRATASGQTARNQSVLWLCMLFVWAFLGAIALVALGQIVHFALTFDGFGPGGVG